MKKVIILAVFLPACSVFAGDLSVDNLSVQQDASFYGAMHAYVPGGDVAMGSFTNQYGYGAGTNLPVLLPGANPIGDIHMFAATNAPSGWLLCNGSAVSRTTYSNLFSVIGTTYGVGDGSTTFNVPDMRGVFPKGAGTTSRAAGKDANGNFYSASLGSYYQDRFQGHRACLTDNVFSRLYYQTWSGGGTNTTSQPYIPVNDTPLGNVAQFSTTDPITDGVNGTPRTGASTEPQSLAVNFIIYAGQ